MIVKLKLFGGLAEFTLRKVEEQFLDMPINILVGEVLDYVRIPPDAPKIIMVNGIHADRDTTLKDGDVISVFPPVAGG